MMRQRNIRQLRQFIRDRSGVAAIEFGIVAMLFLVMLMVVTDYGLAAFRKMQVQNAAQAGAQYAMLHGYVPPSITSAVENATTFSGISATPSPAQFCGCPTSSGIDSAPCGSNCSGSISAGTYVTASAVGTYNTILTYPLIPSSYTFTSQSTVRIK